MIRLVSFDAYLKAFAATVALAFALIALAARRRAGAPLFLGAFLLLIAGNQAAETLRAIATDPVVADRWLGAATVFAAFDPLAFLLFARANGDPPRARWPVYVVATASSVLAVAGIFMVDGTAYVVGVSAALLLFTALVYTAIFIHFLRQSARRPEDIHARTLVYASALVTVLPWHSLPHAITRMILVGFLDADASGLPYRVDAVAWVVLPIVIVVASLAAGRLENGARTRRTALIGLSLGFAVTIVLSASSLAVIHQFGAPYEDLPAWMPGLFILGRASAALRWILFGALVSTVVVGGDLLGLSLRDRRTAARVLIALGIVGLLGLTTGALAVLLGPDAVTLRPVDWIAIGFVLLATQGFRPLIDRVATRLYGVPMPHDRSAEHEVYRRALLQALAEGRDVRTDRELARLRRELAIDPTHGELIARVAEEGLAVPLLAGQRIAGRYIVIRLIARGGTGRVFLARDETLAREVVLKEVAQDTPDDEAGLREARAAGSLAHPNIVVVHDVLRRAGSSLLVTEYLAGGSLADRIRDHGRLPSAEGIRVLDDILSGLEAVHAEGLVHRDLKPENVRNWSRSWHASVTQ